MTKKILSHTALNMKYMKQFTNPFNNNHESKYGPKEISLW